MQHCAGLVNYNSGPFLGKDFDGKMDENSQEVAIERDSDLLKVSDPVSKF